jgi:hypothetical protein
MSGASLKKRQAFDDRLYELLSETFYEEDEEDSGEGVFNFSLDAKNAPHKAWRIFFDQQFIDLNPIANRSLSNTMFTQPPSVASLTAQWKHLGWAMKAHDHE